VSRKLAPRASLNTTRHFKRCCAQWLLAFINGFYLCISIEFCKQFKALPKNSKTIYHGNSFSTIFLTKVKYLIVLESCPWAIINLQEIIISPSETIWSIFQTFTNESINPQTKNKK